MSLRIFIVVEVRLYRDGLALALDRIESIEVVGSCPPAQIGAHLLASRPDIILVDMMTNDSLQTLRAVSRLVEGNRPRIVTLGVDDDAEIVACAQLGIAGLVHRDASLEELIATLESAMLGELRCRPHVAAALARRLAALAADPPSPTRSNGLTARENEICVLIERGLSNKDIAWYLGIEVATVKNHIHNLLHKLQVRRRGEAAARMRRSGMLPAPPGSMSPLR